MRPWLYIACGLLTTGAVLPATLQAQSTAPRFEVVTLEDGLPGTGVIDIVQDRQGFLWLAMWNGLARYDGYAFTTYPSEPSDTASVTPGTAFALLEDRHGYLWVGTDGGLSRRDPVTGRFTRYRLPTRTPGYAYPPTVSSLFEDRQGYVWVLTMNDGLQRLDPATGAIRHFLHDPGDSTSLSSNWIDAVYEDRQGTLWVGTANGLNRLDRETGAFTRFLYDPAVPPNPAIDILDFVTVPTNEVHVIHEDGAGVLWFGTLGMGLCRIDRATEAISCLRHRPDDPHSLPGDRVFALAEDPSGRLWVGTTEGLARLDNPASRTSPRVTRFRVLPESYAGSGNPWPWVLTLYIDRTDILWIGTAGGILFRTDLASDPLPFYRTGGSVMAIAEDADGAVWIAGEEHLMRMNRATGTTTTYRPDPDDPRSLTSDSVRGLHIARDGTVWLGTLNTADSPFGPGTLHRFDPTTDTFTRFIQDPDDPRTPATGWIRALAEDSTGILWLGTWGNGLARFNPATGAFTTYRVNPAASRNPDNAYIYESALHLDHDGTLWVGSNGLYGIDPAGRGGFQTRPYRHDPADPASLSDNTVFAIHTTPDGTLWAGTAAGLSRLDRRTGTFINYTPPAYPALDGVSCIVSDGEGVLWLSTFRALVRFDPRTETATPYGPEKGIAMGDFANGTVCHQGRHGDLFFSVKNGFLAFTPDRLQDNPYPPDVALTGLRIFDRAVVPDDERLDGSLSDGATITLHHDEHDLSIDFVGLHFSRPEANRYAYRLEGYEDDWHDPGTQRTVRYTSLDPGTYVFRVKAANVHGVWNEAGASLRLTITPPWWRTTWAYVLYVLGLALLVVVGYELRAYRLKAYARRLRNEVEARTRDLLAEKQKTETQARRLLELDEAKNRFFTNLSHEFRTPLTLLLGPLQDALDGAYGRFDPRFARLLPPMHRNARRLLRLINQLLDLARLDAGKLTLHREPGDLAAFLCTLTRSFVPLAERHGVTLRFEAQPDTMPLTFDADALEKVFANLLSNALAYTPSGGTVEVMLRRGDTGTGGRGECQDAGTRGRGDAERLPPPPLPTSPILITVRDTGPGIPREALDRIFDRFEQADTSLRRRNEGSGIGLALAKELVELHGGTITVESTLGVGTRFTISFPGGQEIKGGPGGPPGGNHVDVPAALPRSADEIQPTATISPTPPFSKVGTPTLLIVEDNADVRAYLRGLLEGEYRVVEAEDGEAGLEMARSVQPDLVLADVMMPRMDGYELCRLLKANDALRAIPVVMLTAKAGVQDTVKGLQSGADAYLSKPFSARALKARVSALIASRQQLQDQYRREVVVQPSGITVTSDEAAFLEQVMAVIDEHLGDGNFSVDWLADAVGLSRRQLERKIETDTGETPAEMIRRLRIERAAQLLRAHAGTVAEVAYAVGFHSASHFAKTFRRAYGMSPSEYVARTPPGTGRA